MSEQAIRVVAQVQRRTGKDRRIGTVVEVHPQGTDWRGRPYPGKARVQWICGRRWSGAAYTIRTYVRLDALQVVAEQAS